MIRIVALVICVCLALMCVGCKGGQESSSVVLYTSADQEFAEQIVKRFTEVTGIAVKCRFDVEATKTVGLVQRLRSESSNPQADVLWSNEIFETIRLADEGVLDAYESAVTADWPQAYRDGQGRWFGFAARARVLAYNTKKVSAAGAPKSIEDLLDAKWKGRVAMARPQFGTTRGHVSAMWVHYGAEGAKRILSGLKANDVQIVSGNSTAVRMVAEGRADVCLTDTDDVYVAQRNGWSVAMVYPKHGQAGTLVIPNTVSRVTNGPNAQGAGALIDFLLGGEVEEMLARSDSHNCPVRAELAVKFKRYAIADPMPVDYRKVAGATQAAVAAAVKILDN